MDQYQVNIWAPIIIQSLRASPSNNEQILFIFVGSFYAEKLFINTKRRSLHQIKRQKLIHTIPQ